MKIKYYRDADALDMSIGYEDYKELILSFRDLITDKFGDSIISLVLYGSVARRVIILDKEDFFKRRLEELRHRLNLLGSKKVFLEDGSRYWDLKPDLVAGEVFEL